MTKKNKSNILGRVYFINDILLVKFAKKHRRIVAINNNPERMEVRRIKSLYDKTGKKRDLIPIGIYKDIPKLSGAEKKIFKKTLKGKPIKESLLKKSGTTLNKADLAAVLRKRSPTKKCGRH